MELRKKISKILPPPDYGRVKITGWQNTNDIIQAIANSHAANLKHAEKIKHLFDAGNERDTARNIFEFLRGEMRYVVEPAKTQTVKSLPRYIADGYGDCKHLSLFTNTILTVCGYKPVYRFAGYDRNKDYGHVYSYLPKTQTVVDAVLPGFDTEKTYQKKKDINMGLYKISGIDEIGAVNFDRIKAGVKKAAVKSSNVVQRAAKELPKAAQKIADTTKTVSLAIPRNAFLLLVKLNVRNLAGNLKQVVAKRGIKDGLNFYEVLGGNSSELVKAINEGATKKAFLSGVNEENAAAAEIYDGYSGDGVRVGFDPASISAALASAAPILLKVSDVMKKAGIEPAKIKQTVETAKQAVNAFEKTTGNKLVNTVFKKDAGQSGNKTIIETNDIQPTSVTDGQKIATAALASATGVDINTVKEIVKDAQTVTSAAAPTTEILTSPVNIQPAPGGVKALTDVLQNRNLLIGAAALVAAFVIFRK